MKLRAKGHPDDRALFAHLEREISLLERRSIDRHLTDCWKCRSRQDELRRQMLSLTALVQTDRFPGYGHVDAARTRLMARLWQAEPEFVSPPRPRRRSALFVAVGLAAACGILVLLTLPKPASPLAPRSLMAEAAGVEATSLKSSAVQGTVHQVFHILARKTGAEASRRESRLEIWTQPSADRFTSRWLDSSGTLIHALWRPDRERAYAFSSGIEGVRRLPSLANDNRPLADWIVEHIVESDSLTGIEQSLIEWLESRRWVPLNLADSFQQFAALEGSALELDRSNDSQLRLRASRQMEGGRLIFELLLDSRSHRPRLQLIRYENRRHAYEVQWIREEAGGATPVSFEPDRRTRPEFRSFAPPPLPVPLPVPLALPPLEIHPIDLLKVQLEIDFILHRLGACLGEPLEVKRTADDIEVRGVVGTPERQQQVEAALAKIAASLPVRVDVMSAAEAFRDLAPASTVADRPVPAKVPGKLHPWCRGMKPEPCAAAWSRVLDTGESIASEAVALERLAREYGHMSGEQELQQMARDHIEALHASGSRLRRNLNELSPDRFVLIEPPSMPAQSVSWQSSAGQLREETRALVKTLRSAQAGGAEGTLAPLARQTLREISTFDQMLGGINAGLSKSGGR